MMRGDAVWFGFVRRRRPGDAISEIVEDAQERRLGVANGARLDDAIACLYERYAETPTLIIGTHFAAPSAGRLVRDGAAYRFEV